MSADESNVTADRVATRTKGSSVVQVSMNKSTISPARHMGPLHRTRRGTSRSVPLRQGTGAKPTPIPAPTTPAAMAGSDAKWEMDPTCGAKSQRGTRRVPMSAAMTPESAMTSIGLGSSSLTAGINMMTSVAAAANTGGSRSRVSAARGLSCSRRRTSHSATRPPTSSYRSAQTNRRSPEMKAMAANGRASKWAPRANCHVGETGLDRSRPVL